MGNVCGCLLNKPSTAHIDIVVDDTREVNINKVHTETTRIDKIRFILPVIKITNDKNDSKLAFDPSEDPHGLQRRRESKRGTINIPSPLEVPRSGASSEAQTPVQLRISAEAQVHRAPEALPEESI